MCNMPLSWSPDEYKDVETQNYWKKINDLFPGDSSKLQHAHEVIQRKARDHARTPVQWTDRANAGFCDAGTTPWMRVHDNYPTVNAQTQESARDPHQLSVLQFWQRRLQHRKKHRDVIVYGDFVLLEDSDNTLFAYKRTSSAAAFVVVLNFSGETVEWCLPDHAGVEKWVEGNYSSTPPAHSVSGTIVLQPWEGILGVAKASNGEMKCESSF